MCFASFKYPSLSKGGVKRPDEILYPGALTERHLKSPTVLSSQDPKIFRTDQFFKPDLAGTLGSQPARDGVIGQSRDLKRGRQSESIEITYVDEGGLVWC